MSMQACKHCGIGFDLDFVPRNPFKRCPNPTCKAPLEADAVEHTFTEASDPGNKFDAQRLDLRAQLHNDVADHGGDTMTTQEKIDAGLIDGQAAVANARSRKVERINVPARTVAAPVGPDAFKRTA